MKHLATLILLLSACIVPLHGQTIMGGVITSGATNAPDRGGFGMQGAFGQPMIGEAGISPIVSSGIMSIGDRSQQNYESTLITVDTVVRQIGDTFDLPVYYGAPCAFFADNVTGRNWELKVSFNRTIVEPLQYDAIVDDGDRYTITVTGRAVAQNGLITNLRMMTRLGNDSVTDVRVESFRWTDVPRQFVRSVAGTITLRGLCNTYGQTRLLKDVSRMQVLVAPNPMTSASVSIRTYADTTVSGTLMVTDIHGNVVTVEENVVAAAHAPMTTLYMPQIAGGTYTVTFYTSGDVARTTLVKLP